MDAEIARAKKIGAKNEADSWVKHLASEVSDLAREPDILKRFREMMSRWQARRQEQADRLCQWTKRRRQHSEELAALPQDHPRRTDSTTPPEPGWVWEEDFVITSSGKGFLWGWVPPDLARSREPEVETILPLGERSLRLDEKYTLLAAVHDSMFRAEARIAPWPDNDLEAIPYEALLRDVPDGIENDQHQLRAFLGDVKQDVERAALPTALPSGPEIGAGTMPKQTKPSPEESAREIALQVDSLYYENPARWKEQWAIAVQEAEHWHKQQEQAEKKRQAALDAVWREVRAVEAGTTKPRLTNGAKSPGKGWRWQRVEISDPANRARVQQNLEAWMPPNALGWMPDAKSETDKNWPGPNPTLATMYLALAVLHDRIGKDWPKILDSATDDSGAVGFIEGRNFDYAETWVDLRNMPDPGELRFSAKGITQLRSFLNAVRAELEATKKVRGRRSNNLPKEALQAWQLYHLTGKTQTTVAEELSKEHGRKIPQGTVSRWIQRLDTDPKVAHLLEELKPKEGLKHKPDTIDPDVIEMGKRQDGLAARQRAKKDPDSEDAW